MKHPVYKYACACLVALLGGLTLASCNSQSVGAMIQASGRPGEVMLVINGDALQSAETQQLISELEVPAPALPQEEPTLQVTSRINHENFNSIMLRARNILIVNIDATRYSKSSLKLGYNEWAKGQMIVTLNTPSRDSLASYVRSEAEVLRNLFTRHELYRFALGVEERYSQRAKHLVDSLFSQHINVPADINKHKFGKDFLWMSNAQMHARHDLMVYTYPYHKPKDLEMDRLIEVRDSVLRVNIPGGVEGSYPSTVKTGLVYRQVQLADAPRRSELRGLWQMEGGDMMGGPFVLHAYLNKAEGRVYVFESFIYRPNENKLNMLRTMEASLYSVRPREAGKWNAQSILSAQYTKSF